MLKRTSKTRFLFFLASDIFFIVASIYLSFFIRYDFSIPPQYLQNIPYYCAIALGTLLPIFYSKRLYHFTWIYVGINDLVRIFQAITYGFFLLGLLLFLGRNHYLAANLPRAIILIDLVLVFFFVGGIRFAKRLFVEIFRKSGSQRGREQKPKIIIIGAGDAAEQLVRMIKNSGEYPFHLVGILDDSEVKQGTSIHGVPVSGKISDLKIIHEHNRLHGAVIAMPSAPSYEIQRILALANQCGINYIKTLPSLIELLDRRVTLTDVRDINVEDLLGRKKITIDSAVLTRLITEKTVLITGAAGSIGFELVKQIAKLSPKMIVCLDADETGIFNVNQFLANLPEACGYRTHVANILNKKKLHAIFQKYAPEVIFHAAAYKHVTLMEREPEEAVINNILGTWNAADAARESGAKRFVLISTDKAVNPTSVMGISKRISEMLILHYNDVMKCVAVRFGNVLGSRGSAVQIFKEQILSGGPVTVTHRDMERYFMVPSEAILLVIQAGAMGNGGEIFALDMGQPVKILELAETMIRLAGLRPYTDIPIIFTKPHDGEKLREEILSEKEYMRTTKNEDIFIVPNETLLQKEIFFKKIAELIDTAKTHSSSHIEEEMRSIVSGTV